MKFLNHFFSKTPAPTTRIYFDYAAATPVLPEVVKAMLPYYTEIFGNPSAIHSEGQKAQVAVEEARQSVARTLEVQSNMVTFTSGGTESNNLAILGSVAAWQTKGVPLSEMEIITTAIEHPATLNTVAHLAKQGVKIHYVPIDGEGKIILPELARLLSAKTILVSVAYVNSEIGTIQDVGAIGRVIAKSRAQGQTAALLHIDAAQAPLWLSCVPSHLGVDLMSLDAGKFCGPKGVGVLVRRRGVEVKAVTYGGGQEGGLRPGTESVAGIVGLALALKLAQENWSVRQKQVSLCRDYFIDSMRKHLPQGVLNGPTGESRVANNVNFSIAGLDSEFAVIVLDNSGVAASTKSACSSAGGGESVVVKTISDDATRASSTIRFTLPPDVNKEQIDGVVEILSRHIASTEIG